MYIAFKTQNLLGWKALLFVLVTYPLLTCQQQHYTTLQSRKLGSRWGIQLVSKLWNIIFQLWTNRYNHLHETEAVDKNSGKDQLRLALIQEHSICIKDLPSVYKPYFSSLSLLVDKHIKYQKPWFLVIRSGREACSSFTHYDNFSTKH